MNPQAIRVVPSLRSRQYNTGDSICFDDCWNRWYHHCGYQLLQFHLICGTNHESSPQSPRGSELKLELTPPWHLVTKYVNPIEQTLLLPPQINHTYTLNIDFPLYVYTISVSIRYYTADLAKRRTREIKQSLASTSISNQHTVTTQTCHSDQVTGY